LRRIWNHVKRWNLALKFEMIWTKSHKVTSSFTKLLLILFWRLLIKTKLMRIYMLYRLSFAFSCNYEFLLMSLSWKSSCNWDHMFDDSFKTRRNRLQFDTIKEHHSSLKIIKAFRSVCEEFHTRRYGILWGRDSEEHS